MKLSELKPCAVCKGKLFPFWYVVRVSMAMAKPGSSNQVLGLMQMFGGSLALAETMAPDPDCVMVMGDENPSLMNELHICQECFLMKPLEMGILMDANRPSE